MQLKLGALWNIANSQFVCYNIWVRDTFNILWRSLRAEPEKQLKGGGVLDTLEAKMREAIDLRHASRYKESYSLHKQIMEEAPSDSSLAVQNMYNLADVARRIGKGEEAKQLLERAIMEAQTPHDRAEALHHLARYWRDQGDLQEADRQIDRSHQAAGGMSAQPARAYIELDRSAIKALRGNYREAKVIGREAQRLVAQIGESRWHRTRAWVLAHIPWAIRLPGLRWTQGR